MRTPAALPRTALGPLLLAVTLGSAGFAAGWMYRAESDPSSAATSAPSSHTDGVAAGDVPADMSLASTDAPPRAARAGPANLTAAQARERLSAWVAAGCPQLEPPEFYRLLETWSASSPWDVLAFVHGAPQFRKRTDAYQVPLAHIAADSPTAAAAWISRELTDPGTRDTVLNGVIQLTMADHPGAALELSRGAASVHSYMVSQMVNRLAFRDPAAALAWFEQRFSDAERANHADDLAEGWLRADPAAARRWCLEQAGAPHAERVLRTLAVHLAEQAPGELDAVFSLPSFTTAAKVSVLHEVGNSRPDVVLDHLSMLPAENARTVFLGMFETLFTEDPGAALEVGRSLVPADVLNRRVRAAWSRWAESDRPGALAWAAASGDAEVRRQVALVQQRQEIRRAPAAFLASVDATPSDAETRELVDAAISSYTHQAPREAAAWFASRAGSLDPGHARTVAEIYAYQDASEAVTWAQALPPGPARDAACMALLDHRNVQRKVAEFHSLVGGIGDPVLQTQAAFRVFCALADREAAERWLEAQPLSAEVRASWIAIASADEFVPTCSAEPW